MPSDAPRSNADKKRDQLRKREHALRLAIFRELPRETLFRLACECRAAQLSLLKAELHWLREPNLKKVSDPVRTASIERDMQIWSSKSELQIIQAYGGCVEK